MWAIAAYTPQAFLRANEEHNETLGFPISCRTCTQSKNNVDDPQRCDAKPGPAEPRGQTERTSKSNPCHSCPATAALHCHSALLPCRNCLCAATHYCCTAALPQRTVETAVQCKSSTRCRDSVRDSVFMESFTVKTAVFLEFLRSLPTAANCSSTAATSASSKDCNIIKSLSHCWLIFDLLLKYKRNSFSLHFDNTLRSQRGYNAVTMTRSQQRSRHSAIAVTTRSQRGHNAVTTPSQHGHVTAQLRSQRGHNAVTTRLRSQRSAAEKGAVVTL